MALIKPTGIALISGNLSGAEFALTKNGPVVKSQKRKRALVTPRAYANQISRADRIRLWHALGERQIRAWQVWADNNPVSGRLGRQVYLSAFQAFMRFQVDLSYAGFPEFVTEPDPRPYDYEFTFTAISFTEGGPYTLTYTIPTLFSTLVGHINVWIQRWMPNHAKPNPSRWSRVGTFDARLGTDTWFNRFDQFNVHPVAGENIAIAANIRLPWFLPSPTLIQQTTVT